jgi:membrane-associated protease RseP (regulator of RpoE activity)
MDPSGGRARAAAMSAAFLTASPIAARRVSPPFVGRPLHRPALTRCPSRRTARLAITPHAALPTFSALSAGLLASAGQAASTGTGIAILGAIIFFHECGHYFAARWQGIRVKNFSVGFGPTLFSFVPKGSETEFTLRALPLGGYVAFADAMEVDEETGEKTLDEDPDLLQNRPVLDRAIVISAGVVANIVLAWASIFVSVSAVGLPRYDMSPGVMVTSIVDSAGAGAAAGMRAGDVILSVDDVLVLGSVNSANQVASKIRSSNGQPLDLRFLRDGVEFSKAISPKCCSPTGDAAMGIQLAPNAAVTRSRPSHVMDGITQTNGEFMRLARQTVSGFFSIVTNFREASTNMAGPVGVVAMGATLAASEKTALLTFCAVISLNLALINSLPLPALDGGQLTFLLIEALRGSPVSLQVQDAVNRFALVIFLSFSGVLLLSDLGKLPILGAITRMLH